MSNQLVSHFYKSQNAVRRSLQGVFTFLQAHLDPGLVNNRWKTTRWTHPLHMERWQTLDLGLDYILYCCTIKPKSVPERSWKNCWGQRNIKVCEICWADKQLPLHPNFIRNIWSMGSHVIEVPLWHWQRVDSPHGRETFGILSLTTIRNLYSERKCCIHPWIPSWGRQAGWDISTLIFHSINFVCLVYCIGK